MPAAMNTTNYYDVLEVSPIASQEVIHAAYRALARSCHPDVNPSVDAARRMQQLNTAYKVLGDAERRAQYDLRRRRVSRAITQPVPRPPLQDPVRGRARPDSPKRIEDERAALRTMWTPVWSRLTLAALVLAVLLVTIVVALWISSLLLDDVADAGWTDGPVGDVLSIGEAISNAGIEVQLEAVSVAQPFLNHA
jgi:DnaJ domain